MADSVEYAVDDPAVPLTTGRIRDTRPVVARTSLDDLSSPMHFSYRAISPLHAVGPWSGGTAELLLHRVRGLDYRHMGFFATGRRALFRVPPFHVRPAAAPSSLSSSCAATAPTPLTPPSVTALSLSARPSPRPARSPPQSRAAPSCCATPASVVPYVDAVAAGNCCSRRERPGC
ncbi:hypothetical protein J3S85_37225 [Streptomyces lavenduligriseus]|nr:hypothetical protein J3S85_37225 [Streptomyces lavenduligriseus]